MNAGNTGNETGRDPEEVVENLRADIDQTRRDIDRTVSEIEARLNPDRLRAILTDTMQQVTTPWRERPMEQLEVLGRETMTRIREMAWMNPLGLGLAAAVVGYLMGRRTESP